MNGRRIKRTVIDIDNGVLLYKHDEIKIWQEYNKLYFESVVDNFISDDYCESVSSFMRIPNLIDDNNVWGIKIDDNDKYNINISNSLYILSGGDIEWKTLDHYKYEWSEVEKIFVDKFEDIILKIIRKSKTLGDIKRGFMEHLNLPIIYEFSLNNGLLW